jgi:dihydroorotate dehydrogenase (fumarate)
MDLTTTYMGMALRNPLVVSACPLSEDLGNIRQMEDCGAAAVVLFSLFEEQLRHEAGAVEHFLSHGTDSFAEALSYFPRLGDYSVGPDRYLDLVRRAKEAVGIPVIASLNGVTNEGWVEYARDIEQAGADGMELNVYYIPADLTRSGAEVEQRHIDILKHVKSAVSIPVAMKLSPYFSAPGWMCRQLDQAGADALVLFNRFWQPDLDIEAREVLLNLNLSGKDHIRPGLLWIALLHGKLRASLAATSGVDSHEEVIKYVMAGADAVMTASALLRHGIEYLRFLLDGLTEWMKRREYESISQMKGSMSHAKVADPEAYERAHYVRMMERYKSAHVT